MVRRKLISASAVIGRSLLNAAERQSTEATSVLPQKLAPFSAKNQATLQNDHSAPSLKYIDERVNNVFNIILAEIKHKDTSHPTNHIYRDPYNYKNLILQDLVSNADITTNYAIHDLIEEEFGLEISDQEFKEFKSLSDIVKFVRQRLEIRNSLLPNNDSKHGLQL